MSEYHSQRVTPRDGSRGDVRRRTLTRPAVSSILLALTAAPCAADSGGFSHGVAAGDVTASSAIVWTRADASSVVRFELATDEAFANIEHSTEMSALPADDLTIKLALSELMPATDYFYRFATVGTPEVVSPVGRFRTAPTGDRPAALRFVFSGDVGFRFAPFPIFTQVANEEADFLLFFGDTVYADDPAAGSGVAITLEEYRGKYREIRSDPYVQEALATLPVWVGWDDHEVTDNYVGASPEVPAEQLEAAYQAFFEYMPLANQQVSDDPYRTYRRFRWGSQIEFFLLDGRQYREPSAEADCGNNLDPLGLITGPLLADPVCAQALSQQRSLLGREQFDWLTRGLAASTAAVKIVVNDVPLSYIGILPYDRWDGYDAERRALLEFINEHEITGVHLLTTDIHSSWYNPDVTRYFRSRRSDYNLPNDVPVVEAIVGPLGVETLHESVLGLAADALGHQLGPLLRGLLTRVEQNVARRLRCTSGFSMIETNRVSYLLVDVTPDGPVELTYRGVPPSGTDDPNAGVSTFFSSSEDAAPSLPCCLPIFTLLLAGWPTLVCRARERRVED